METLKVKAFAKVNLLLNVYDKLDNGYHVLETIVVPAPIYNVLKIKKRDDDQVLIHYDNSIGFEDDSTLNLAKLMQVKYKTSGFEISVSKNIPVGAGLGGSSSDAGALASALTKLFNISNFNAEILMEIGSDVPYMYYGGAKLLQGIGDKISDVSLTRQYLCLLIPPLQCNTSEVFDIYDKVGGVNLSVDQFMKTNKLSNALEKAAILTQPTLEPYMQIMEDLGFYNKTITGSGSSIIAAEKDKDKFLKKIEGLSKFDSLNFIAYEFSTRKMEVILNRTGINI